MLSYRTAWSWSPVAARTDFSSGEMSLGLKRCSTIGIARRGIGVVGEVGFASRKGIMVAAAMMGQQGKRGKRGKRKRREKKIQ